MRKSANKLTKHECNYASSTTYPQIKHEVMQKTNVLLNSLGQKLGQLEVLHPLPLNANYKISKGENYQLMPYMVLDYPQLKDKAFKMVLRTMFWWGHHFSCQLIMQTACINLDAVALNLAGLRKTSILTDSDIWNHDATSTNYTKLKHLNTEQVRQILEQQPYLKLISTHPIETFNNFEERAMKQYKKWMAGLELA
jgi:hypothetical protein